MFPNDLLPYLHAHPFRPFRLVMLDGTTYDIRHPELVMVSPTSTVIGYPHPTLSGAALNFDLVGTQHITRLEFIDQPQPTAAEQGG